MSKQTTMLIEANFDVAQVSPMLECKFTHIDSDEGTQKEGKNAGSVCFKQGQDVAIQVNAGGEQALGAPRPFLNFRVVECALTTRPRVYRCGPNEKKVVYAPPSLFSLIDIPDKEPIAVKGATIVVPGDFDEAAVSPVPPGSYRQGRKWKGKLTVGPVKARWRLTLMVTVEIDYADSVEPEIRVFEIDPETEVGNGTGGLEEEMTPPLASTCVGDPETEVGNGTGRT